MITVSVIMPYFKKRSFFKNAYYSVLKQNFKKLEVIIIYDDQDLSDLYYLKKIINNRKNTILLTNKKNYGVSYCRNIGIKKAKGKYLAFLDCDDVWNKNKLKNQINFMREYNLNFTHTSYSVINESGKYLYTVNVKKKLTYNNLLNSCDIGLSTVVIKKDILHKNPFKQINTKEDYLLWLELSKIGYNIIGIRNCLSSWRNVKGSLSDNLMQKIKDSFKIYYYYEKQFLFRAILSIFVLSFFAFKKKYRYLWV